MKPLSFALLLLTCLLHFTPADAIPARIRRQLQGNSGMVTMPLKRHHVSRGVGLHPQVSTQQHINRASKRLARMTGREEPSERALRSELHKRLYLLEDGAGSRSGAPAAAQGLNFSGKYRSGLAAAAVMKNGTMGSGMGNSTKGTGNGTVAGGNGTSNGVSPLDIQAATNGGVTVAKPPTVNNSLGLDIEANDVAYIATVQIGTPPRDFKLLMDSGSADFWVAGENCQSQQGGCGNHTTLGAQGSSSFVQSNQQFEVTYGSGAVQGLLCQDNVNIAGLALNNHTFGVATAESIQFASATTPFDGLMGLAQSKLSQEKVLTPVESLASNKIIQSPVTSFKIPRLADQLNDGQVTFGGLDASKFVANTLVTIPNVNNLGFWEGVMDTITVNGTNAGLTGRTAILDTGTTLILAPPSDAQKVMQSLGGACDAQQCTIPCTTKTSLALSFGNASFAIDPRDLAVLPIDPNNPTGTCTAGIQPQQIGTATEWLVGDVFLKNAYFSTNVATNQISLAKLTTN
ncbi:acid protease [Boletus edulis BED1]|uniref:Acid protease n=1 Tax=Boletus edulis BED1 TaxID=1328754 RepID=A0AAD4GHB8_BOLED|nr:acid protease [Boletus edulis BED1]